MSIIKKGTRCCVMNCEHYSKFDTYMHHKFPRNKEMLVNITLMHIYY